jgi:GTP-binding protein
MTAPAFSPKEIEAGRLLFARPWRFQAGAPEIGVLPASRGVEVAFAGRSNVGKSSLINALAGQRGLARVSGTPGRTRELNFFESDGAGVFIVDLPGYGYAKGNNDWSSLLLGYLRGRPNLRRVFLLIDSRHGLKPNDEEVMDHLDTAAVSYQVVLTKADKLTAAQLAVGTGAVAAAIVRRPAAHPEIFATSAENGAGLPELRAAIARLVS